METGIFNPSKGHAYARRILNDVLIPVSPTESGKGLPYAPIDWPNLGDIWGWKVGKRIRKRSGFHQDRYLIAPKSLQERPSRQILFGSKLSVVRFIRSKFPNANINAFVASFSWEIPAKATYQKKGKFASKEEKKADGIYRRTRRSKVGRKFEESADDVNVVIELTLDESLVEEETLANDTETNNVRTSNLEKGEVSNGHAAAFPNGGSFCASCCKFESLEPLEESEAAFNVEEFDNYVDALDEILNIPLPGDQTSSGKEEIIEAREKLSSLLAMGFPSMISFAKLNEFVDCASKHRNDSSLTPRELSMVKLIEEIPLRRKAFLEAKEISVEADKFFSDLDSKIASATSLKQEYNKSKEEKEILQAEEASALLAVADIENQIAALQAFYLSLTQAVKVANENIAQCTSTQKRVMDSLPKIVQEVQAANSMKAEWELKKKKSAEEEAEILAKFSPLEGFFF